MSRTLGESNITVAYARELDGTRRHHSHSPTISAWKCMGEDCAIPTGEVFERGKEPVGLVDEAQMFGGVHATGGAGYRTETGSKVAVAAVIERRVSWAWGAA
jgi:hypothetical protein